MRRRGGELIRISFSNASRYRQWMRDMGCEGRAAMRISVSSWVTTEEDCERSLAASLKIASEEADG